MTERGRGARARRAAVLRGFGAPPHVVDELLAYDPDGFPVRLADVPPLPLPDEPFVEAWRRYLRRSEREGVWPALLGVFPQLHFPVEAGMSADRGYRDATRKGGDPASSPRATGLRLEAPDALRLEVHAGPAGSIPVVVAPRRGDFERLLQALAGRNEPVPVPPSQGAAIVRGYNNWDRVRAHRERWRRENPGLPWAVGFRRLVDRKEDYQDRFLLLSEGPYSGVPAGAVGMSPARWREASLVLRREHECAHDLTVRLFGTMRGRAHDEVLADAAGIMAAVGRFRRDWLLAFLGVEDGGAVRPGARLRNYRGDPPLGEEALAVLGRVVAGAAATLEAVLVPGVVAGPGDRGRLLVALASLSLEELAGPDGPPRLRALLAGRGPGPGAAGGPAGPVDG